VRTVFNLLGPLTNPAGATRQLLGVYARPLVETIARVLAELGSERAWVVHADDGLDEISTTAATTVAEVRDGAVRVWEVRPETLGLRRATLSELEGGTPEENAALMTRVLAGEAGALADVVALNAAAALCVAGAADRIESGLEQARAALASGAGAEKLEELRAFARSAG
jgi:anthranilate phosphoribosyltransferase